MPIYLVGGGLGPGYQTDILRKILEISDKIYVETYTVPSSDWLVSYIKENTRGEIIVAGRSLLEEKSRRLVREARKLNVAVVVPGDPLIATTHRSILMVAAEEGVEHRVVPGSSGVCAAKSLSLLDYYKFGRTVTIPGPWRKVKPYSVLGYIYDNACIGLHTLVLLDISPDGSQLPPPEAVSILVGLEEEIGVETLSSASGMVVERAGYLDGRVRVYRRLVDIHGVGDDWMEPASIIIPGELSPIDVEVISKVYGERVDGIDRAVGCGSKKVLSEYLER